MTEAMMDATRDRVLRQLVEQHPDDPHGWLVYADWLEEQADMPRARFLRLQQELRTMDVSHRRLLDKGRELQALGRTLPSAWVEAMTYPRITASCWQGKDDAGSLVLRFLPGGILNYSQPSGTYQNGTWTQVGSAVAMETNRHYADYHGVIVGDVLRGAAHNIVNKQWRWKVTFTTDPAVTGMPEVVNTTIYGHHAAANARDRARPAPAKRKRSTTVAKPTRPKVTAKPTAAKPKPKPKTKPRPKAKAHAATFRKPNAKPAKRKPRVPRKPARAAATARPTTRKTPRTPQRRPRG